MVFTKEGIYKADKCVSYLPYKIGERGVLINQRIYVICSVVLPKLIIVKSDILLSIFTYLHSET